MNWPALLELRSFHRWVGWRIFTRRGELTKPPVNPHSGCLARVSDSTSWGTFEEAVIAVKKYRLDGIGFVLNGERFVCIDLDNCRDPENGTTADWARNIVFQINSYTEISPSGTGLHIWTIGLLPCGGKREGHFEIYSNRRYMTITGKKFESTPGTIEDRAEIIASYNQLISNFKDETIERHSIEPHSIARLKADLRTVFKKASNAANGNKFKKLYSGDWREYNSQSEADLAFCSMLAYWTNREISLMDALFRKSGLMRKKWDEMHFSDGITYGERTLARACSIVVGSRLKLR